MDIGHLVTVATPFVGRARDLAELRAAMDGAIAGNGSLVLLVGEPGIGKTRLAERLVAEVAPRGVLTLWGRAWEDGGTPPFWPWIQVLRQLLPELAGGNRRAAVLSAVLEPGGPLRQDGLLDAGVATVIRLVPELAERVPEPAELAALEPSEARFRLFDGAATLLARASEAQPILVVLDDLHWADVPSLLLTRFIAQEARGARLLVLGSYRDILAPVPNPCDELVAALGGSCHRIMLGGLDDGEVGQLLALTTGSAAAPVLAAEVRERTGGNPLFVREVARLLAAGVPDTAAVPEGVQAIIGQRLRLLSAPCAELLTLAAVLGGEPRLDLLSALSGHPVEEVLELLGEAAAARLVEQLPGQVMGWGVPSRWRFTHALIREVLYAGVPAGRRLALHRRAGETIEARFHGDREGHLVELADHFLRAGPAGADKAVAYSAKAGHRALALTAWEEAARQFERALGSLALAQVVDAGVDAGEPGELAEAATRREARRCDLELALADARMAAGEVVAARAGYERAAAIARRLGDVESLAHAAFGLGDDEIVFAVDELQVLLLEEAIGATGDTDSALRARLLGRLAKALIYGPDLDRRVRLCAQATAMARRVGDPAALAAVLMDAHQATDELTDPRKQLADATVVVQLAEAATDRVLATLGHSLRTMDLLTLGEGAELRAESRLLELAAAELHMPRLRWLSLAGRASLAILDGRFDEAERRNDEALTAGLRAGTGEPWAHAPAAHLAMRCVAGFVRGDLTGLEAPLREMVSSQPSPIWRAALAAALATTGRDGEAREQYERLAVEDFGSLPRDGVYSVMLATTAMLAAGFGDAERAAILSALLRPYDGQVICATWQGGCLWPVSHHLGLLAATGGRFDDAVAHFQAAIEQQERLGALPYLASTRYHYALALRRRGQPGDQERAARELDRALALSRRFGIRPLFSAGDFLDRDGGADAGGSVAAEVVGVFRREGEYWTVGWQGGAIQLHDSVGLGYLARLLADPGQELHALELASPAVAGPGARRTHPGGDGGPALHQERLGPLLDEQAKRAYRQRLQELEDELAAAATWNDQGRAARARAERDALTRQLAAATRLGGRDRTAAGSAAERARVSVTKALRATIRRIAEHDPALGEHLRRGVRTGNFCAYDPDPERPVTWDLS